MSKYKVSLAENYVSKKPFMVDWDYDLIGDVLREKFDRYFALEEEKAGAATGSSKRLIRGEYVKKFMIKQRVNLVLDPENDSLKSVFLLKRGEEKMIDGRAYRNLNGRFGYRIKEDSEGGKSSPLGFLKFEVVQLDAEDVQTEDNLQIEGNDIQYFQEEETVSDEKITPVEPKEEKKEFVCEQCGKKFDTAKQLSGHNLVHSK